MEDDELERIRKVSVVTTFSVPARNIPGGRKVKLL
jgi:hypothetical protein